MTNRKYTMVTLIGMITLIIIFIYNFGIAPTKAYADNITEAQVTTNTTQTNNTQQVTNTTQATTRQAPVSIAVYSNEVTESSDTYSYNTAVNTSAQSVVSTTAPSTNKTTTVASTPDPQSTAAPEATPEPDIITYPPTVAPPYKD